MIHCENIKYTSNFYLILLKEVLLNKKTRLEPYNNVNNEWLHIESYI